MEISNLNIFHCELPVSSLAICFYIEACPAASGLVSVNAAALAVSGRQQRRLSSAVRSVRLLVTGQTQSADLVENDMLHSGETVVTILD